MANAKQSDDDHTQDTAHVHGPDCDHDSAHSSAHFHGAEGIGSHDEMPLDDMVAAEVAPISVELLEDGPCEKRIRFEIPANVVNAKLDSNYDELRKTVQLPGFRKGRVPRSLLEKRYAKNIEEDVRDVMIQDAFEGELKKRELQLLGRPRFDNIDFKAGAPLRFETVFEVVPAFELSEYAGLEVAAHPVQVTDDDVAQELEALRERHSTMAAVTFGEQREDDVVLVDLRLDHAGQEVMRRAGAFLKIGLDRVDNISVDGLKGRLLAATQDSEFAIEVKLPGDFPRAELREQSVLMSILTKSVHRLQRPDLDDEFAANLNLESIDDLRDTVRKELETRGRIEEERRQEDELLQKIGDAVTMELPQSTLQHKRRELATEMEQRLHKEGKSKEEIESAIASDQTIDEAARRDLKQLFILGRIADRERVFVTEEEIVARIKRMAMAFGRPEEEIFDQYEKLGLLPGLRDALLREKVRALLRKKAKLTAAANGPASAPAGRS